MTAPTALDALAGRVEAATGADRELDCRISLMLFGGGFSDADVADMLRLRDEPTGYGRYCLADEYVPAYTASLDAAMTLIGAPFDHIEVGPPQGSYVGWTVHIIPPERGLANTITGYAATYALALCAAALRARARTQETTDVE